MGMDMDVDMDMDMDLDAEGGGFPTVDETAPAGFPAVDLDQLFTAPRRVPRRRTGHRPDPGAADPAGGNGSDGHDGNEGGDGAGVTSATAHLDGLVHFSSDEEEEAESAGARKKAAAATAAHVNGGAPRPLPTATKPPRAGSFEALGLDARLVSALHRRGYRFPTPVQRRVIPAVLAGGDVVAMARTGSGKTAAFLAPLLHRLAAEGGVTAPSAGGRSAGVPAGAAGPAALVLSPTRELALQTFRFAGEYSRNLPPGRTAASVVVGGEPLGAQFAALSASPPLLIATPGRLLQLAAEMKGRFTLGRVGVLVLDEADRLFEPALAAETGALLALSSAAERQTLLVSATMPRAMAEFARTRLRADAATVVRLDAERSLSPQLAVGWYLVRPDERMAALAFLLRQLLDDEGNPAGGDGQGPLVGGGSRRERRGAREEGGGGPPKGAGGGLSVVVFAATRHRVEEVLAVANVAHLVPLSAPAVAVHGQMDQAARSMAIGAFRRRESRLLIVTDVAARGLDLPHLDAVVHADYPPAPKLFVHRSGRVARAGRPGVCHALVTPAELPYVLDTCLFLSRPPVMAGAAGATTTTATAVGDGGASGHAPSPPPPIPAGALGLASPVGGAAALASSFVLGTLPGAAVDAEAATLAASSGLSSGAAADLRALAKASANAHGLYVRTRPAPSGASVARAKALLSSSPGGGSGGDRGGRGVAAAAGMPAAAAGGALGLAVHPWWAHLADGTGVVSSAAAASTATAAGEEARAGAPPVAGGGGVGGSVAPYTISAATVRGWRPRDSVVVTPASLVDSVRRSRSAAAAEAAAAAAADAAGADAPVASGADGVAKLAAAAAASEGGGPRRRRRRGKAAGGDDVIDPTGGGGGGGAAAVRRAAAAEDRSRFFLASSPGAATVVADTAYAVSSGGAMGAAPGGGPGSHSFRRSGNAPPTGMAPMDVAALAAAVGDATMDVLGDDADALAAAGRLAAGGGGGGRAKKVWDRVKKRYVGVETPATRGVASLPGALASADGSAYKKWLSGRSRGGGDTSGGADAAAALGARGGGEQVLPPTGLGGRDFRAGAYGRRRGIAAAAAVTRRMADAGGGGGDPDGGALPPLPATAARAGGVRVGGKPSGGGGGGRGTPAGGRVSELRTPAQVAKARKLKSRAAARSAAKDRSRDKGKGAGEEGRSGIKRPSKIDKGAAFTRSKVIVRPGRGGSAGGGAGRKGGKKKGGGGGKGRR